jgi:hypothetical protein
MSGSSIANVIACLNYIVKYIISCSLLVIIVFIDICTGIDQVGKHLLIDHVLTQLVYEYMTL